MKKHFLLLASALIMGATATAQNSTNHPIIEVGSSLQFSHDLAAAKPNLGADLRLTCQLNETLRVRALANVNGFFPNGFDRYGAALLGLSAEYGDFYGFGDLGVSLNPSSRRLANIAADLGAGLRIDLADRHHLFVETGFEFTVIRTAYWGSCYFLKVGYTFTLTKLLPQCPPTNND